MASFKEQETCEEFNNRKAHTAKRLKQQKQRKRRRKAGNKAKKGYTGGFTGL